MRFTVKCQKGESAEYTFYAGPSFNDAVMELKNARASVHASGGWVAMWSYSDDTGTQHTLVWEES